MKKTLIVLCSALSTSIFSQNWVDMMQEPGHNFYEIQAAFNQYWKDKDFTEKGKGFKQFKRWEYFVEKRVYPTGDLSLISTTWNNFEEFTRNNSTIGHKSSMLSSSTWTAVGPMGSMSGSVNGLLAKAGRDNFVTFDPNDANTYWCGTPSGGLWKTTNNGASWTTNTDALTVIGCSDMAIDPTNTNIMYLATGDGEGNGDTYSIGVLKSTDGGTTWNPTGLVFPVSQQRQMRRILVNPVNPQIIIAVGNFGVRRSTDAGATWTQIMTGNFYDAEFKPGNPNVVFAAGAALFRSLNGGANFSQINAANGIPTGANRMNIAVTPADSNYVYVLASKSSNSGYHGLFRSTNGGASFTTMSTAPNILASPCNPGTTLGGQGWYDLSCAASPLNKDEVVVGGVNVWRSFNGGANFSNIGCWTSNIANPPQLHADHHELEYTPSGKLYVANDGGIFEHTGTNWIDHTTPRNIAQIYKIGLSSLSSNRWITGHQDNGTNIYNGTSYVATYGGDGMDCFIDRTNDNTMFASLYYGGFRRSTNGGASWSSIVNGLSGGAAWVCPWKQDPVVAQRLYAGYSQLFVSNDLGLNWSPLTNTGGSGYVVEFAIAPSDNQTIYVIHGTSLRKTTDGGNTWTNITNGVAVTSGAPTFITVDPNDANTVWVTLSGYSVGNKVFQTTNGGASWTNISYNLPNLPANCSVFQPGSNDRIYIGMDVGVYVKDNSSTTWTLYNAGLPNVPVSDLEISPAAPTLLRAGTYGRGVYEVELMQASSVPQSDIGLIGEICVGSSKQFMDYSTEDPTAWNWSVLPTTGVNLSSANTQNPLITFANSGTYTISLTASNGFGTGSISTKTITVHANPIVSISSSAGGNNVCVGDDVILTASGAVSYTWTPNTKVSATQTLNTSAPNAITYTIQGRDALGCVSNETVALLVAECTGITTSGDSNAGFQVFPNPASNRINIKNLTQNEAIIELVIEDVSGKVVLKQNLRFKQQDQDLQVDVSALADGVYLVKLGANSKELYTTKLIKE